MGMQSEGAPVLLCPSEVAQTSHMSASSSPWGFSLPCFNPQVPQHQPCSEQLVATSMRAGVPGKVTHQSAAEPQEMLPLRGRGWQGTAEQGAGVYF